ncbi:MAG: RluA family pseudouridine synthase [Planctomycetia bacterium]|nr:RluA family pseudouridine synthase [Planctomycetia bacterium]
MQILYEDGPVLVVNKPSGLLVQAPPGIDSMVTQIKTMVGQKIGKPCDNVYLGVPHRLDRPATGAMVFALSRTAARRLSEQFQMRMVAKKYWVLVEGNVPDDTGDWEDFLRKVPDEARAEVVSSKHPEGRWALLHYRVLRRWEHCTHLEIELETGRTHQIRLQAASRGFPVLGDAQYGAQRPFGIPYDDERLRAIALHSRSLCFKHPQRDERLTLTAPLPQEWQTWVGE